MQKLFYIATLQIEAVEINQIFVNFFVLSHLRQFKTGSYLSKSAPTVESISHRRDKQIVLKTVRLDQTDVEHLGNAFFSPLDPLVTLSSKIKTKTIGLPLG